MRERERDRAREGYLERGRQRQREQLIKIIELRDRRFNNLMWFY